MWKVEFGSVREVAWLAALLIAGCQTASQTSAGAAPEPPSGAMPAASAKSANNARNAMGAPAADSSEIEEEDGRPSVEAEGIIPEPDVGPCKNCTVDVAGRVRGGFQTISACPTTGAPVVYPVKDPRVEITAGAQEGLHFSVDVGVSTFNEGQGLIGAMAEGAIPDGWVEAKLWVTDANGKVCASSLAILH